MSGRLLHLGLHMCKRRFVLPKFEQLLLTEIKSGVVSHFVIISYICVYSYHFFQVIFMMCNMNRTHLNLKLTIFCDVLKACFF